MGTNWVDVGINETEAQIDGNVVVLFSRRSKAATLSASTQPKMPGRGDCGYGCAQGTLPLRTSIQYRVTGLIVSASALYTAHRLHHIIQLAPIIILR